MAAAPGPAPSKLVCLYANVEYLTQLHTLLEYMYIRSLKLARLNTLRYACLLYFLGPIKAALTQKDITDSGGELLQLL